MNGSGTKGWMVASITMLTLVFVLAMTLTIVLLDKDGRDEAEAIGLGERLNQLEMKVDGPDQAADDDDHDDLAGAKPGGNAPGKKDPDQGNKTGGNNQGQQLTDNEKQVVEALGYNYASSERPDLNWQVTGSSVNGDNAEVTVTASYAQGMEVRTFKFKKQNGQWLLNGGGSGSAVAPPGP